MLEPLIRHIQRLDAYSEPVSAGNAPVPSVWVAHLPGARLSIGLSPEKSRGFSGEGSVLQALSNPNTAQNADMLSVLLSFEPRIDVPVMSARADWMRRQPATPSPCWLPPRLVLTRTLASISTARYPCIPRR